MGLLARLVLWAVGFALRWLFLPSLLLLAVALHPPTLGALVSKMAMAVGGGGAGKGKKMRQQLKHFRVQAITLLRLRLEGLEATVVEGGKEASVLVLKTMELRPTIKAALFSFFQTKLFEIRLVGIHAKKLPWASDEPAQEEWEGAGEAAAAVQEVAPPKPKKKAAAASGDGGPFASVTQDGRAWHRLVWLSKMVSLTVEDVSMEMTTLFAPAGAAAPGSTYACVSGGFASFTVGATHVVHPKQVLSLDVNLKGLWARGVTKRQSTDDAGAATFAQLAVEGMATGIVLEPLDPRPASAYFAVQGTPTVRVDPAHMPPPSAVNSSSAAEQQSPSPALTAATTPCSSASASSRSSLRPNLTIDTTASSAASPPPKPPIVDVGALPKRGFFSLPGLDIAIVGPAARALRITTAIDFTWVSSHMVAASSEAERPTPGQQQQQQQQQQPGRRRQSSAAQHHRRHSTTGLKMIRRKTLRGGGDHMDMSLSRILQDADKEEDDEEDEDEVGHGADAAASEGQAKAGMASGASAAEREQPRVCVVPRMACREIKVALEGMPAPIFHLKEWNTEALIEVGLLEAATTGHSSGSGSTALSSPHSQPRPLPSPSSIRNLAVAAASAAATTTGPAGAVQLYHPHKGRLLKSEVHSEVQRLALHASGGFLAWARGMHRLAVAAAPPAKMPTQKPAPKPQGPAAPPPPPMVAHEATLRMAAFSLVADRLEDWEEEEDESPEQQPLGLSGSGADAGRVAHPHARYEVHVKDIFAASTAAAPPTAAGAARRRGGSGQQHLRPFFRQRSASGTGAGVAIPSSSDDEDAAEPARAEEGPRAVLLHKLAFRVDGGVKALVRLSKPTAARVAAGKPARFAYLLSEVQEPVATCFRFRVATMQGESEQAVALEGVAADAPKAKKPEMKVAIGEIVGEEGLLPAPGAGPAAEEGGGGGGFVGLQFLSFPAMSVVMGEEEEAEAATATQELLAAVAAGAQPSAPSRGSSAGAERRPVRELMTAHAAKAYVRASFDLAIKGLMLGDVQKRTQASVKRFTESLNQKRPSTSTSSLPPQQSPPPSASGMGPGSPAPLPPALSPLRKGMAMHLSVDAMQVELVLANPAPVQAAVGGEEEEGSATFMAILVEMKSARMSMVERHRRVPLASLPHPAFRVPSVIEMVMDAGALSLTAVHGEETGRMLEATGLRACYEKVPAFFGDCGLKCVALAEGMDVIVPPSLHLGAVIAAGISQKAALDTAMRRWEEIFHGRDFSVPRKFMPNVIRALFRQGAVRLCQGAVAAEKGGKDGVAMEMRLTEWRVNMDMDKPNEELRAIAQRLDSDTDVKEWGAVVGGETLIGAETLELRLGNLPTSMPMLAAHGGFRVKGTIVGAAPAPDPALCAPGSSALSHVGWPAARSLAFPGAKARAGPTPATARLPPAVVFPTVKDGLAVKVYGDAAVEMGSVRAVYGAALLPLLDAVNAVVARATPPSTIPEPHPLPWWDKMRYQVHGTWLVTAREMHLLHLTSPTYEGLSAPLLEASAVSLHLAKVSLFLQRALHEFCFHNFVVALPSHAPPTESSAWAHPPAPVAEALAALAEKGGADKGRALVGSYDPVLERHRFMAFPKLSVRLQYNWECLNGGSPFKHHIQSNLANPPPTEPDAQGNPPPDKYAAFRARGLRLQLDVSVLAQDKPPAASAATPAAGAATPLTTTLRWPGMVEEEASLQQPPASPERPKSLPTRSSSGGYTGGRPNSARFSNKDSAASGPPLSSRPWLIMRLDLLRWLKLVSTPPAPARGRRASSLSSSAASAASADASPRRRRRREGGEHQHHQQPQKAPSPNFGRLISGMNVQVQVERPCVAMWPGRRIGLEGVQQSEGSGADAVTASPKSPSVDPGSPPRRMSSATAAALKGFEGRGMLMLMRDLVIQHGTELLPGQEHRSLTATTPLVSRTLLSRQDAEGVSLFLMSFLRCHDAGAWRLVNPTAAAAAAVPVRVAVAGHERSMSTPLSGGNSSSGVGVEESPFFVETARFLYLLEALHAAREPEDFLAGTRYLEVNADSTGKGEGGAGVAASVIDPLKGYSLQRGSTRALSLSRSYSLESLGTSGHKGGQGQYGGGNGEAAAVEAEEVVEEDADEGADPSAAFRPSFASFVLNHQMMRPPPESVPAFHNTDLPRWRDPTPPSAPAPSGSASVSVLGGLGATDGRRRSNPLLQSSSFGEGGAARRRSRAGTVGGEGAGALGSPVAGPAPATTVVIVTELRILWTLAARTAVNHFSTQMSRHMQAYNGTTVAFSAPEEGHSDSDSEGEEGEGDEETELPAGLTWQDSQSDLLSGVSTVYSPPPGEQGQSDLTRMFLQKGGSGSMTGPSPSPSNYMSQTKRGRTTMLGGVGGGLDMRPSTGASGPAGGGGGGSSFAEGGRTQRGSGAKRKEDYRVTFKVILLYPQINFRSENANGSFVVAAKEAYMEGRKHDKLFKQRLPQQQPRAEGPPPPPPPHEQEPPPLGAAAPHGKPRRPPVKLLEKSEQWLRIDNVRAYVVPLDVEATREVHWLEVVPPSASGARPGSVGEEAARSGPLSALLGVPSPLQEAGTGFSSGATAPARPSPLSPKWGQGASTSLGDDGGVSGGGGSGLFNTTGGSSASSGSRRAAYDFRGTAVVQEVVKDFSITFASIAFNPAVLPSPDDPAASLGLTQSTDGGAGTGAGQAPRRIRVSSEETVGKVLLDLPQLDWNLNSRQFYITLDVVRNVLLAAPVRTEEEEEEDRLQERLRRQEEQRKRAALAQQAGAPADAPERALDLSGKADRELFKTLVEAALQRLAACSPVLHETKVVQYCVGGGTWKVKAEEGRLTKYDAVEVGFTGFSGQHVYFHDGSTDSTIQVESFWVRNLMPGPDSALFQDDVTTVMCPVVLDKQPCQRCGEPFEQDDNRQGACVFHATEDGVPGEFRLLSEEEIERQHRERQLAEEEAAALGVSSSPLVEEEGEGDSEGEEAAAAGAGAAKASARKKGPPGTSSLLHRHTSYQRLRVVPPTTGRWTCCGATHETAPGCRARAHVGKETMLNVRAKSHAPLTVAGLEVHPYQFMELSIFPGANYKLTIQLTRNVMELFHAYFLTQDQAGSGGPGGPPGGADDTAETKSNLLFGKSAVEQKHKAAQQGGKTSFADRITKSLLGSASSSSASSGSGAKQPFPSPRTPAPGGGSGAAGATTTASAVSASGSAPASAAAASAGAQAEPVVYMKYVRFGDLNIKASVSGFAIKLDGYRAAIPAFVRQGRVLTWKRLIRKFEKHVAWSVTTSAASSMVGGGKSKHHAPAPAPQLLPAAVGGPQGRDKEDKERERGVKALFSPPVQEDRSKLLFGGKH